MPECPSCHRSDFPTDNAYRQHLYRERHKNGHSETPKQSKVIRAIDEESIIENFKNGEMGEQDAVNEFQSQWELSNPQPKDCYREWSSIRAKSVDDFRERLIRAKPHQPVSQAQSQPQIPRQLSINDIAEMRAMELRGELPTQTQAFQTPLFEPEQPVISSQPQQQSVLTQSQRPAINIVASLKSAFSRLFPRKQQPQMPERPLNEYGMPASNYQCFTCGGAWLNNRGEVTMHLVEGHITKYIP